MGGQSKKTGRDSTGTPAAGNKSLVTVKCIIIAALLLLSTIYYYYIYTITTRK
jgi:hypothetical protein